MLLASVFIHTIYYYTLSMSYRSGDLSQVYPLFRGLAPVLVVLGAAWLAHEYLAPGAMLGIGLVSAGLISITFSGGAVGKIPGPALRWGLATSVLIAAYTVADGMGVIFSGCSCSNRSPSACGCWRGIEADGLLTCTPGQARSAPGHSRRRPPTGWLFTR